MTHRATWDRGRHQREGEESTASGVESPACSLEEGEGEEPLASGRHVPSDDAPHVREPDRHSRSSVGSPRSTASGLSTPRRLPPRDELHPRLSTAVQEWLASMASVRLEGNAVAELLEAESRARQEMWQENLSTFESEVQEFSSAHDTRGLIRSGWGDRPIYSGRLAPSLARKRAPGTDGSLLSQREYTQDVLEGLCRALSADLTEVPVRAASEEIAPTDTPTLLSKQYLQDLFDHVKRAKSAEEQTAVVNGVAKSCSESPAALTMLLSPDETQTRQQLGHYVAVYNRTHLAHGLVKLVLRPRFLEVTKQLINKVKEGMDTAKLKEIFVEIRNAFADRLERTWEDGGRDPRLPEEVSHFLTRVVPADPSARPATEQDARQLEQGILLSGLQALIDRRRILNWRLEQVGRCMRGDGEESWHNPQIGSEAQEYVDTLIHPFIKDVFTGRDTKARTPLHLAVWNGHVPMAEFLVMRIGADLDSVESGGYTPLFFAVYKQRYEALKLLLRAGADISARSQPATRLTALCQTCMLKTTADTRSIFRTLLGCTPDSIPVCGVGVFRQEPRNAATNEQRKELIGQWLEQWKRNIDLRSGSTVRPADVAEYTKIKAVWDRMNKCIERSKILVEEHWIPQVDYGLQQFYVRDWGLLEFRQLVARHCYPPLHPDPPVLAGRYGMPRWAVGMISDEYGINEPEANGVTPLMAAVRNRALPLVEDLIRLGALPNLTNIDHDTVLHIAVNAVWVDCTRTLCTQCTQLFEWERAWDAPVIEGRKRGFERAAFPKYADMYMDMWVRGGKHAIPSECAEALNNRNLIQIFEQHITGPQAAGQGSRPPGAQLCAPGALDNSIPDKWTCLICTSLLCQPAKLPCGHVFCLRCITKAIGDIVRSDKSLSGLICPFRCEQRPVQLPWLDEDCHRLLSTGEWWAPQKLTPEEEAEEGRRLDTGERYYRKHITERLSQRAADCLREFKPTRRDPTEDTVPDLMLNESGRCPVEIHGKRVQYAMVQDVLHVTSVVMTGKEVEQVQMPCDWVRLARLYLFVLEGNYRGRSACSGSVTLNDLNELVMHLHIQLDLAFRSAAKECTTLICRATEPYRTTLMQLVGKEEGTRPVVPTEIPNPENLAEVRGNMFKVRLMVSCLQHMLLEAPAHGGDADTGGENKEWYCRTASPTDGQWVCEAEGEHPVHLEYDEAPDVIRVTTTVLEQFPHRVDVQGRLFGMLLRGNVQPEGGPPRGVEYIEQSLPGLSPAIHDGSVILQMAVQVGASPHTKLRDSFRDYVKFAGALRDKSNKIINQIQPPQSPEATSISTTERQLQHQIVERRVLQQSGISADQRQTIISMANNLIYDLDFLELHIAFVNRGGAEGPNPFEELDAEAAKAQQEPPEHSASRHRVILSDDTVRRRKGLSVFPFTLDIAWAVLTLVWELAARGKVRDVQVYLDAPGGTILSSKVWHRFVYCSDGGLFSTRVLLEWLHCIAQCNSVVQAPLFIDNSHCSAILDEPARNSKVFEHLPRPWKTRMPPDAHTERERRRSRTIKLEGRRRAARLGATGDIGVHGVVPPKESEMAAAAPPQTSAVGESPQLPRSMGKRFRCSQRAARKAQGLDAKSRELAARMSRQDTVESNVKNERRIPCVVCGGRGYVEE
eukprot:TRINITY_DN675_c1_g1_i2.p1 TRINITY_DN675_c1_g1~~TRINITY_DN675_c1_g1_i2.p1  ORF type:complete len:1637 (+),score=554.70 TRINITY_DN675_c1_g1_i2:325-5235(+)